MIGQPAESANEALIAAEAFEPFVDADIVAAHLDLEHRQVLELTRAGKLPAHPVDPNAKRKIWRYKLSEVDAAISGIRKPVGTVTLALDATAPDNGGGSPRSRRG